jgi:tRNA wybutosine-synthesizing protein 3
LFFTLALASIGGYLGTEMDIDNDLVVVPADKGDKNDSAQTRERTREKRHPGKKTADEIFEARRQGILGRLAGGAESGCDHSPKGSVDELCVPLMELLNAHPDYVTTSSCSGRIALFHSPSPAEPGQNIGDRQPDTERQKRGCGALGWLFVSHEPLTREASATVVSYLLGRPISSNSFQFAEPVPSHGVVALKCEAFVMHIQCRDIAAAKRLLTVALASGFRNSGAIPPGANTMMAIRHAGLSMDAPLIIDGCHPFAEEGGAERYLTALVALANKKLEENCKRLQLLTENITRELLR